MSIFKAYDIRGIYPDEINEDIIFKIGRAYSDILKEENPKKKLTIVVGRDMRLSSPELTKSLINGVIQQGVNVINIGLASTPTFYFAVSYFKYDGGMIVSASHNPKEYNGIKIVRRKATPVSIDTGIREIEKRVTKNILKTITKKGNITSRHDILDKHVKYALKYADSKKIKPFKVVVDAANAMGSVYIEKLFRYLPCKLIKMNFKLDGSFPAHLPSPYEDKNIIDLQKKVIEEKADLGIAIDGDGDRVFFIDDKGERVESPILRGILAKIFLRQYPGSKICYDIRPGRITKDIIVENQGIPVLTKVGHSLIKEKAIKENALLAVESSGHYILKMPHGVYEIPMIAILKILQELSQANISFSEYCKPYKKYFNTGELNFKVADKDAVIEKIKNHYKDAKITALDGISIEYNDFWFNLRPSNTEPLLRLNLEAATKEKLEEKKQEIIRLIKS